MKRWNIVKSVLKELLWYCVAFAMSIINIMFGFSGGWIMLGLAVAFFAITFFYLYFKARKGVM